MSKGLAEENLIKFGLATIGIMLVFFLGLSFQLHSKALLEVKGAIDFENSWKARYGNTLEVSIPSCIDHKVFKNGFFYCVAFESKDKRHHHVPLSDVAFSDTVTLAGTFSASDVVNSVIAELGLKERELKASDLVEVPKSESGSCTGTHHAHDMPMDDFQFYYPLFYP
jgi:hypothetical protein